MTHDHAPDHGSSVATPRFLFSMLALCAGLLVAACHGGGGGGSGAQAPTIQAVSDLTNFTNEAKAGEIIQVTGSGFGAAQGASTLTIGGLAFTTIQSWSDNLIHAFVPAGASSGNVVVQVGGVASNAVTLVVPWSNENSDNSPVANWPLDGHGAMQMASDGASGAILVWEDYRTGNNNPRIYAQRVDRTGQCRWGLGCAGGNPEGVPVSLQVPIADGTAAAQRSPRLVADGSGGAIVVWQDARNAGATGVDLYAQRIDADGNRLWTADVAISAATGDQVFLDTASFDQPGNQILTDGSGGAIVAWQDERDTGTNGTDIYAQRVSGAGAVQWTTDGVALSTAADTQWRPQIASDGAGGAILVWEHLAPDPNNGTNRLFVQRVSSAGAPQWTADGKELVAWHTAAGAYREAFAQIVADQNGGAIIVWRDRRFPVLSGSNIDAQRVDQNGTKLWSFLRPDGIDSVGVPVSEAPNNQVMPRATTDGAGGVIVVWDDNRDTTNVTLYAQRLSSAGVQLWENGAASDDFDGVPVSTAAGNGQNALNSRIIPDGAGGAIVAWADWRNFATTGTDIYAQRLTNDGSRPWTATGELNGLAISSASRDQRIPELVADGYGGAVIAWRDSRNFSWDLYAQGISANGRQ